MYLLNLFLVFKNGFMQSPREGYAQLSLAYACHDLGKKATVTVPKGKHNWLTTEAIRLGCNIIECDQWDILLMLFQA